MARVKFFCVGERHVHRYTGCTARRASMLGCQIRSHVARLEKCLGWHLVLL